jgi:hypothetical protein
MLINHDLLKAGIVQFCNNDRVEKKEKEEKIGGKDFPIYKRFQFQNKGNDACELFKEDELFVEDE